MEKTYKYDAFISYRHVSPDKPIAERLQKLLETYVPPKGVLADGEKKKLHLFRDETELPTSNDLGGDIRRALEDSRFLVVICSPEYEKSKWCMEEVRCFKELHGGSNRNILTILADDPDKRPAFPEELRFETVTETLENGETVTSRREIEPLAANVCAKTEGQMLKKLKTEFLRIAAPLLGCGYDDLYHREQRRAAQRKLRIAFGTAAVLAVGVLLSTAALLTIRAKNQQIAADAQELSKTNADILIKESLLLEKDGDLWGALETAVQAYPDEADGFEPAPDTIRQLADLTDVYLPRSFTPVNKFTFSFRPRKICLFEGGKRLAVVTAERMMLIDTESGETLKTFLDGTSLVESSVAFYRDPVIDDASVTTKFPGVPEKLMRNGTAYYNYFSKDIRDEIQPKGNAIYILDENKQQNADVIERIAPDTGEVVWSFSQENSRFLIKNCSGEGVVLKKSQNNVSDLLLLSADTGELLATIGMKEIASHFSDFSEYDINVFYGNDCLIIAHRKQFCVFRRSEDTFTFLFVSDLFPGKTMGDYTIESTFLVRDETVFVSGHAETDYWDHTAFISGHDLNTGERKWIYEETQYYASVGVPYLVYFEPDKGSENAFGVVAGVEGDRLFLVNAETGAEVCRTTLPDAVLELYYTERGFLFMTDAGGSEILTSIRKITDASDSINLHLNRSFSTDINLAAYCNNLYAVCRNNDPAVLLYRLVENDARNTLTRCVNEDKPLWDVLFSPDHKVAALYENLTAGASERDGDEKQLRIIDVASKETLQTITLGTDNYTLSFLGNEHVAVVTKSLSIRVPEGTKLRSVRVYSVKTGEKILDLTEKSYRTNTDSIAFTSAGELFISDKNGIIWKVHQGESPEEVSELKLCGESEGDTHRWQMLYKMFASSAGNKLFLWMDIISTTYAVSETGTGENASMYVDVVQEETSKHIYVYDTVTKTVTECFTQEALVPSSLESCVFTADESAVYLLFSDNTVTGFSCETGEQLCLAKFEGNLTALITLRNDLCIVNTEGDLIKIRAQGAELAPQGKISLADETLTDLFTYTPMQNGRGLLRYGKSYGWIIDENAFAVVGDIIKCCGIDEESGLVYQSYYDYLYSYQLRSDADLLALAKERLGE